MSASAADSLVGISWYCEGFSFQPYDVGRSIYIWNIDFFRTNSALDDLRTSAVATIYDLLSSWRTTIYGIQNEHWVSFIFIHTKIMSFTLLWKFMQENNNALNKNNVCFHLFCSCDFITRTSGILLNTYFLDSNEHLHHFV